MTDYRIAIPGTLWRVGNDTPVWFKPRRTVYFVTYADRILRDANGRNCYFPTAERAAAAMERLANAGQDAQ